MKVNGFQLRESLNVWKLKLSAALNRWNGSQKYFPSNAKPDLKAASDEIKACTLAIAQLEAAQQEYNSKIQVAIVYPERTGAGNLQDATISLSLSVLVKLVGGAGRMEHMWRGLIGEKKDRYAYREEDSRSKENEYALPTYTAEDASVEATAYAKWAARIRAGIANANTTAVDLPIFDSLPHLII